MHFLQATLKANMLHLYEFFYEHISWKRNFRKSAFIRVFGNYVQILQNNQHFAISFSKFSLLLFF